MSMEKKIIYKINLLTLRAPASVQNYKDADPILFVQINKQYTNSELLNFACLLFRPFVAKPYTVLEYIIDILIMFVIKALYHKKS